MQRHACIRTRWDQESRARDEGGGGGAAVAAPSRLCRLARVENARVRANRTLRNGVNGMESSVGGRTGTNDEILYKGGLGYGWV